MRDTDKLIQIEWGDLTVSPGKISLTVWQLPKKITETLLHINGVGFSTLS